MRSLFWSLRYYIKGTYLRFQDEDVLLLASGIAFNGLLCLLPLVLLMTSVIGVVLNSSELAAKHIQEVMQAAFPSQPDEPGMSSSVQDLIRDIIHYRKSVGLFGTAVLAWTATSLFSATRTGLNRMFKLRSSKMAIFLVLEDFLWVILAGLLFLITNFLPWVWSVVKSIFKDVPLLGIVSTGAVPAVLSFVLTLALTFCMFFIVYRFIPHKGITSRVATMSAGTTTVLWTVSARVFQWYLSAFHSYSQLYGAYAFILVFLLWIYYFSIIFVLGSIVGQLYRERIL